MNWFEDQIKYRERLDAETLEAAIDSIASAVMGKRLSAALEKDEIAESAIDEILKFYHCTRKEDIRVLKSGSIEERLDYALRPFNIMYRGVSLEKGWYKHASGAMLATMKEDDSIVCLIPGKISGYRFFDPKTEKWVRLNKKTEQLLDKDAICFYQALPLKPIGIKDLLVFMMQQLNISDIFYYLTAMLIVTLLGLLPPLFTRALFGSVLDTKNTQILLALAGFMLCFTISQLCISAFQTLVNARIETKQEMAVQAAVMNRLISLPTSFFKQYSSGELLQRSNYIQSLCSTMFHSVGSVAITSLFSLVYIAQIFSFAAVMVVPSILITLLTILISLSTTSMQMKVTKKIMETSAKTTGVTYSTITGIQKIKLAGAENRMFARWAKEYTKQARLEYDPPAFLKLNSVITLAVSLLGTMLMYWIAVKNGVDRADYNAFNASYGMVAGAFMSFASMATVAANIKPSLDMARTIMEAAPETADGKEIVTDVKGAIELSHISFRYSDSMPNVLDDLSLKIKPGEYLAIVGKTGCGKSTLLRLLLGFEQAQRGSIYFDRKNINNLDLPSLRRKCGVVMQDGKLFQGDIYSNIVITAPQLSIDDAWEAAEIADVAEDIRKMPMGMYTVISDGQGGVSGGQRQRLLIARAVASKPKILLFDEATSALDNVTQKKVSDAIDQLKCTRIVIAHRLSTIQHADRIVYLENGKILEEGTYQELLEKNGAFAELIQRQRIDLEEFNGKEVLS